MDRIFKTSENFESKINNNFGLPLGHSEVKRQHHWHQGRSTKFNLSCSCHR